MRSTYPLIQWMVGFGEAMFNGMFAAETIKEMRGQQGGLAGTIAGGGMTELTAVVRHGSYRERL